MHIRICVRATKTHGQHVVEAGTHRVWICQLGTDLALTDSTSPFVSREYLGLAYRLVCHSRFTCPLPVMPPVSPAPPLGALFCTITASAIAIAGEVLIALLTSARLKYRGGAPLAATLPAEPVAVPLVCGPPYEQAPASTTCPTPHPANRVRLHKGVSSSQAEAPTRRGSWGLPTPGDQPRVLLLATVLTG